MPARLVPLTASPPAPTIVLQRPVLLIGRHPDCDARIDLPQVSRRHCCLAMAYDRLLIRDLGSRNGVRVNGRTVSEVQLKPGDEIAIAHVIFRLEDDAPAKPIPTAALASQSAPPPKPTQPSSLPELPATELIDAGQIELIPLEDD